MKDLSWQARTWHEAAGSGGTDRDPHDRPFGGRPGPRSVVRTGMTDRDPVDTPGYGRGGVSMRGGGRITDTDPRDPAGSGRGMRR